MGLFRRTGHRLYGASAVLYDYVIVGDGGAGDGVVTHEHACGCVPVGVGQVVLIVERLFRYCRRRAAGFMGPLSMLTVGPPSFCLLSISAGCCNASVSMSGYVAWVDRLTQTPGHGSSGVYDSGRWACRDVDGPAFRAGGEYGRRER